MIQPAGPHPDKPWNRKTWNRMLVLFAVASLGMVVGALLLASILAGEIYDYQDTVDGVHLPKVDAIVVLAGGKGRISAAGDLGTGTGKRLIALSPWNRPSGTKYPCFTFREWAIRPIGTSLLVR